LHQAGEVIQMKTASIAAAFLVVIAFSIFMHNISAAAIF